MRGQCRLLVCFQQILLLFPATYLVLLQKMNLINLFTINLGHIGLDSMFAIITSLHTNSSVTTFHCQSMHCLFTIRKNNKLTNITDLSGKLTNREVKELSTLIKVNPYLTSLNVSCILHFLPNH